MTSPIPITDEAVALAAEAAWQAWPDSSEEPSWKGLQVAVRAAVEAALSHAGGSVGPEQADASLLAIHDALVRSDAHPGLTAASREHLNVVGLVQRIEEMKSEVERLRAKREVTDEMVERAVKAYEDGVRRSVAWTLESLMRAALRAALSEGERHG